MCREASCVLSDCIYSHTVIGLWCAMDRPSMTVRMVGERLAREAGRRSASVEVDERMPAGMTTLL